MLVNSAWLTAHLGTVGFHVPKSFPASPKDLLGKTEAPKPMSKESLRAMLIAQGFNPPKILKAEQSDGAS